MSQTARMLIGCVKSSDQRYGMTVILDTLRGSQSSKIRSYRMDQNPYFGKCKDTPLYQLRQVLNQLLFREYLRISGKEYPILKLTEQSDRILEETEPFLMKMAKEPSKPRKENGKKSSSSSMDQFSGEVDKGLFERLRLLRLEIAKEEKVPPYIVFSDKTLVHMCLLRPGNKEEMLEVSGVGEMKFEKYGKQFLEVIQIFLSEHKERKEKNERR